MQMYCNDGIKKKNHFCGQQSHAISFTSTPNNCAAWLGTWSKNFAGGKLKGGHTNTLIIIMWQRWKTLWGRVLSNINITNGMYHDKWIFQKIPFLNWIPFHNAMLSYLNVKGIFIDSMNLLPFKSRMNVKVFSSYLQVNMMLLTSTYANIS